MVQEDDMVRVERRRTSAGVERATVETGARGRTAMGDDRIWAK